MAYIPDPNDPTQPADSVAAGTAAAEFRALKAKVLAIAAGAVVVSAVGANPADMLSGLFINTETSHRDKISAGFMPSFFNQQNGGAPHYFELVDTATNTPYKFEASSQYIEDYGAQISAVGDAAASTGVAQGFKVSKSDSYPAIWVKLYKNGNPANNLELRIQADDGSGTKPTANFTAIANGTATALGGKLFAADASGQYVRFSFPIAPALVAGTQYWFTLKSSGAVDPVNYWSLRGMNAGKRYPHGAFCQGTGAPVWTAFATISANFLIEAPATTATFQAGGAFGTGKAVFFEGAPLNQSNGWCRNLRDIQGLNFGRGITLRKVWTTPTKDKTLWEMGYGLDHDRIVLRVQAITGFPVLTVYKGDTTVLTVTGTVDVSLATYDIGFYLRAAGDGADVVDLQINGVSNGVALTAQTIVFDKLFQLGQVGTEWVGGGFPLAPVWTTGVITSFTALPSGLGYTYTGTAPEATAYSFANGKLYQNYTGFGAAQTGYYLRNALGFVNATGYSASWKMRPSATVNTKDSTPMVFGLEDPTKAGDVEMQYYFAQQSNVGGVKPYPQIDLRTNENVFHQIQKLTDCYTFVNNKLLIDGTGNLTVASGGAAQVYFGDSAVAAGENADAIWSYVKPYSTGPLFPQFTAGELSEYCLFTGDKRALLTQLYNSGVRISAKAWCGIGKNWAGDEVVQRGVMKGITVSPTTTAATPALLPEMEFFCVGSDVSLEAVDSVYNSTAGQWAAENPFLDGLSIPETSSSVGQSMQQVAPVLFGTVAPLGRKRTFFGLHKAEIRWHVSANTGTSFSKVRTMRTEARA